MPALRDPVRHSRRATSTLLGVSVVAAAALGACSSSGPSDAGHSSVSSSSPAGTASAHVGDLSIAGGYIPKPAPPDVAAAYFTVTNSGSHADQLVKVTSNVTSTVMAMTESDQGATGSMTDLTHVSVPAHGSYRFTQGHAHLMLEKPVRSLQQGDKVTMTITFARAGTVKLVLPVVPIGGPGS